MTCEQLDKFGDYFVRLNIRTRYDVTFEIFLFLVTNDMWDKFKDFRNSHACKPL